MQEEAILVLGMIGDASAVQPILTMIHDPWHSRTAFDALESVLVKSAKHLTIDELKEIVRLDNLFYADDVGMTDEGQTTHSEFPLDCKKLMQLAQNEVNSRGQNSTS